MIRTHRDEADREWMEWALLEARLAGDAGEVPVGAIIVHDGAVLSKAHNLTVRLQDATAHAECLAIREASAALGAWRLDACTLYVTLEPCAMCAGAIVLARIERVVFGAWDDKAGMGGSVGDVLRHPRLNHQTQVSGGVNEAECGAVLQEFFAARRTTDFVDTPRRNG